MNDKYTIDLNYNEIKYILKSLEQSIRSHDLSNCLNIRSIKDISKYSHDLCDITDLYLKINSIIDDKSNDSCK